MQYRCRDFSFQVLSTFRSYSFLFPPCFITRIKNVSYCHYRDISFFECKTASGLISRVRSPDFFQRLFPLLELSHVAFKPITHLCVQHLYKRVLHGVIFQYVHGLVLYCSIVNIYIIFILSISTVLEMLVSSSRHVYTYCTSCLIISTGLKRLCLVTQ